MLISIPLPDWPAGFTALAAAKVCSALADAYLPWYKLHPLPPLYQSGVRWQLEPGHGSGVDEFASPWTTYARGWGDCDDLLTWRLLELRAAGIRARPAFAWRGDECHVLVSRGGRLEDPSEILRT